MRVYKFEELIFWQKAKVLTNLVYKNFSKCRDFGFNDQIKRASVSIMNNIAEGFERSTNKDFRHFLFMAKGSAGEVRSMLYIALEQSYLNKIQFDELYNLTMEISKLLSSFIKKL